MMKKTLLASAIASVLALSACTDNKPAAEQQTPAPAVAAKQGADATMANPLLTVSPLQYQAPQFDLIKVEHYLPAMEAGIIENAASYLTPKGYLVMDVGGTWQALDAACQDLPLTWCDMEHGGDGICLIQGQDLPRV